MDATTENPGVELLHLTLWNHRIERTLASASGLPVNEFHCMMVLFLWAPESARDLSDLLGVRDTSLSKLLRKLERRQLVVRMPSVADRRIESVHLTDAGKQQAERAFQHASALANTMLGEIAEDRRQQFRRCIRLLFSSESFKGSGSCPASGEERVPPETTSHHERRPNETNT